MSSIYLNNGIFEDIGESVIITLDPISQVTSFNSFTDSTQFEDSNRFFKKEFRYKLGYSGSFTNWIQLTNLALSNISATTLQVYVFEIKYTRIGTDNSNFIKWKCFEMDAIEVEACFVLKINKDSYDSQYGISKYFEILSKISEFNNFMIERGGDLVFPVVDNTIIDKNGRDMILERKQCAKDTNFTLRTLFGKYLIDSLFQIKIDTYDGIRS